MCLGVYNCLMYYARNIRSMKKCCDIYIYMLYIDYNIYIYKYIYNVSKDDVCVLHRHSRRRLRNLWAGPINAALKRLKKLATVTPVATSTLSASSAALFLCRFSNALSSSLAHAGIRLQPSLHSALYKTPGSRAAAII